jgi:hypothetical protein
LQQVSYIFGAEAWRERFACDVMIQVPPAQRADNPIFHEKRERWLPAST